MTMLDHNRARTQLAQKAGVDVSAVKNMTIWGNHSATQYPDFFNTTINGKPVLDVIDDHEWLKGEFITTVQKRGAAIIAARGLSSAASAANAAIDHIKNMITPTEDGNWYSAAVVSDGSYGVEKGLYYSFPVRTKDDGSYEIVQGLSHNDFANEKLKATEDELARALSGGRPALISSLLSSLRKVVSRGGLFYVGAPHARYSHFLSRRGAWP